MVAGDYVGFAMIEIKLEAAVDALEGLLPSNGYQAFSVLLERVAEAIGAKVAAAWKYNIREGYFSCYCRCGYQPNENAITESIHPADNSLLAQIMQDVIRNGNEVFLDLTRPDIYRNHWAKAAISKLSLKNCISIPFFNNSTTERVNKSIRGLVIFYFTDSVKYNNSLSTFISFAFSEIYTNYFLRIKDDVTNQIVDRFSALLGTDLESTLDSICKEICCPIFNVEACSIYEWSPHNSGFKLSASTGLLERSQRNIYDRRGDGLISAIAAAKKTVSIQDLKNTQSVGELLRQKLTAERILRNIEKTASTPTSALFIPVFNPMTPEDQTVTAVIKLVNKKLWHSEYIDYFDDDDIILADEVATMMALYEEQSRSVRQQVAFALQFGHEAQAPAVGIRGTADRIIQKLERGDTDQVVSMATDIFDFSELLISFSESLTFGFGDRNLPLNQRYSFRQFNLRKAIDAAKKVVIPICRGEKLPFDEIKIVGNFPLIFSDQRAFMQVFYNLLTNAIKYRDRAEPSSFGIVISCRFVADHFLISDHNQAFWSTWWRQAKAHQRIQAGVHLIEVQDYGIGVPAEEGAKVFLQGFRSPSIGSIDIRGSGIGLSIVRNILADFGGRIWLENNREPTAFRFVIPDIIESSAYSRGERSRRI